MTTTSLNLSANGMKKHRQSSSWLATLLILAGALMLPLVVDSTTIGDFSYFLLWTFGAIGLAAMWGHGGILSFGQTAFFGLAGYAYGVMTLNFGAGVLSTVRFNCRIAACRCSGCGTGLPDVLRRGNRYFCWYRNPVLHSGHGNLYVTNCRSTMGYRQCAFEWFQRYVRDAPLSIPWVNGDLPLEDNGFYYLIILLLAGVYWG